MTKDQENGVINISSDYPNAKSDQSIETQSSSKDYPDSISKLNNSIKHHKKQLNDSKEINKSIETKYDKANANYVNYNEEDQMEIFGYRKFMPLCCLTWLFYILTIGILRLLFHWKPQWWLKCTHILCPLSKATKVMLIDHYNQTFVEDIHQMNSNQIKRNCYQNYSTFKDNDQLINQDSATATDHHQQVNEENTAKEKENIMPTVELLKPIGQGQFDLVDRLVYFTNKKIKYIWDEKLNQFNRVTGLDSNVPCSYFYSHNGLSIQEQENRRLIYGLNEIMVEVQSVFQVLFNEILGPFYVFQIFSIIIWSTDDYYYYASCIVIMSAISLATSVIQIRKNQKQLRDTVKGLDNVTVCLDGDRYINISSTLLVPGDIIVIPSHGGQMQCDAVLISGNVIVNESMLTGESVPVTKTAISTEHAEYYDVKEHGKHTLYGGTMVIQTRFYNHAKVKAMVIRTGYLTSKGELVRSILFPKPVDFQFNRHIYRFINCLALVALCGFTYTVILKYHRGVPFKKIFLKAIDLVTIIIPPALPAAMTVGVVYAQSRLKKNEIFCISPRSINISGCLNCICFDKTGTLTEDDLSFAEVLPVDLKSVTYGRPIEKPCSVNKYEKLIGCLTTCHSLTLIEGKLIGDPLDQKMFDATNWKLEEPEINDTNKFDLLAPTIVKSTERTNINEPVEIGILRQFQFSSSLQRMSVITRQLNEQNYVVFSKGAPEMIFSLCDQRTLPSDVHDRLHEYTEKGYRVLALAMRELHLSYVKMQKLSREETEKELTFLGLLVMGNMLKPETKDVINVLKQANIRSVMVTGDNMLTALSVSRECNMIDSNDQVILLEIDEENSVPGQHRLKWKFASQPKHSTKQKKSNNKTYSSNKVGLTNQTEDVCLSIDSNLHIAITGRTFAIIRDEFPDSFLEQIAVRGTIFARMSPEQKQQLIELLQSVDYFTAMCGDGANDCGALKAAHAGVSLSETEASVASPFTSKQPNISCIPILIREGRASLVTAFGILRYMALYSLTQFVSVIILYTFYSNLTDLEFLYIDLFLISVFFVFFGRTEAHPQLARKPPPSSLIGIVPLLSMALQLILIVGFQTLAVLWCQAQTWYKAHSPEDDNLTGNDNFAVFAISVFQYISLAVILSKGKPYRKAIHTNCLFLTSVIVMTLVTVYIILYPDRYVQQYFEIDVSNISFEFRLKLVIMAFVNFVLAFVCESLIVDYFVFHKLKMTKFYQKLDTSKPKFKEINQQTKNNTDWLKDAISVGIINKAFETANNNHTTDSNNTNSNISNGNISLISNNNSTVDLISRGYESDHLNNHQDHNKKKNNLEDIKRTDDHVIFSSPSIDHQTNSHINNNQVQVDVHNVDVKKI